MATHYKESDLKWEGKEPHTTIEQRVKCKYCVDGPVIVQNYDQREAKLYAAHLKHKHG